MPDATASSAQISDEIERYIRERLEIEVGEAVPAIVSREEDRRFSQLKWLVALVGVVGLGTFGTLSNYLIEKAVDSRLEAKTGNMTDALDFIRFNSLSQKLESGTSFSREDRAAIMSYLRKSARNERVRFSPDFIAALTQVLESFAQAGQSSSIDEILQLYERELLNTDTIAEILIHHYGQRIVGRQIVPKDDSAMSTFEKLEAISNGAKLAELALAYRVLFTHKLGTAEGNAIVAALLKRVALLDQPDRKRFFREILERTKAGNWQRRPSEEGRAFEAVCRGVLGTHSGIIASMAHVDEAWVSRMAQVGVDEDELMDAADRLGAHFGEP